MCSYFIIFFYEFWIISILLIFLSKYPPICYQYFLYIHKIQVLIYLCLLIFSSLNVSNMWRWSVILLWNSLPFIWRKVWFFKEIEIIWYVYQNIDLSLNMFIKFVDNNMILIHYLIAGCIDFLFSIFNISK